MAIFPLIYYVLTFVTPRVRMRFRRLPMDLCKECLTAALTGVSQATHTTVVECQ